MGSPTDNLAHLKTELAGMADRAKAAVLAGFFKTGPGQYGHGDVFLGITVPRQRAVAKKYAGLPLGQIRNLLAGRIHEHRLVALIILADQFRKVGEEERGKIFRFYLASTARINNWDLVDLSAPNIVGEYLLEHPEQRGVLETLARSESLWERRIAMLAAYAFIRRGRFAPALKIAGMLLRDRHDLIHKAVGWMLREVGKRDAAVEEAFLDKHAPSMPRTMLRYAIERFSPAKRAYYMKAERST